MKINFDKGDGLVPAIVQDARSQIVLMLGYMNAEALKKTQQSGRVTFYSRSRNTLWTKGETSGHFLYVRDIRVDCDGDTLLIKAEPAGPVCHTGSDTCFDEPNSARAFLSTLEALIARRAEQRPENSYTTTLFERGVQYIAQKVGEEAVETALEAVAGHTDRFKEESADLLYHLLVLFQSMGLRLDDILEVLQKRHGE